MHPGAAQIPHVIIAEYAAATRPRARLEASRLCWRSRAASVRSASERFNASMGTSYRPRRSSHKRSLGLGPLPDGDEAVLDAVCNIDRNLVLEMRASTRPH